MQKLPMPHSNWIILGSILLIAALSLLLPLLVRKKQRPPDEAWSGIIYSNPDDPALLVPKRYGIGYTLNFGNPWSWVVLVLMLVLVAAPIILPAAFIRRLPR